MTTKIKNTIGTMCGALACVSVFAAVCVTEGKTPEQENMEMIIRCGGAVGFAVFALLWAKLKENN